MFKFLDFIEFQEIKYIQVYMSTTAFNLLMGLVAFLPVELLNYAICGQAAATYREYSVQVKNDFEEGESVLFRYLEFAAVRGAFIGGCLMRPRTS